MNEKSDDIGIKVEEKVDVEEELPGDEKRILMDSIQKIKKKRCPFCGKHLEGK